MNTVMNYLNTFLYQNGYGFYVWGAYGMAILAISLEIISLHRQRLATLTRIRRLMRRHNQDNAHET